MRKSRCTEEQMEAVVRQADRDGFPAVAKRQQVSGQTMYTWKERFGTFQPVEVRDPKQLEQENMRRKQPSPGPPAPTTICTGMAVRAPASI